MVIILYAKFGNPSEFFVFETVEAIAHFIFSVFLIIGAVVSMVFYVSPEESKRRRVQICCKCCCCKGEE